MKKAFLTGSVSAFTAGGMLCFALTEGRSVLLCMGALIGACAWTAVSLVFVRNYEDRLSKVGLMTFIFGGLLVVATGVSDYWFLCGLAWGPVLDKVQNRKTEEHSNHSLGLRILTNVVVAFVWGAVSSYKGHAMASPVAVGWLMGIVPMAMADEFSKFNYMRISILLVGLGAYMVSFTNNPSYGIFSGVGVAGFWLQSLR